MEFLQENYPDDALYNMEDIDQLAQSPLDAVERAFHGGRYKFSQDTFNPNDEYFFFNGYANYMSVENIFKAEYLNSKIDSDEFIKWCEEQGYDVEYGYEDEDEDIEDSAKRKPLRKTRVRDAKRTIRKRR